VLAIDRPDDSFFRRAEIQFRCAIICFDHLGKTEEALAYRAESIDFEQTDVVASYCQAGLFVLFGQADDYRRQCAAILSQSSDPEDAMVLCTMARPCILAPGAVEDPMIPVDLVQRAIAARPHMKKKVPLRGFVHILAMAYLRAGMLTEAEQRFHEGLEQYSDWPSGVLNLLGLALLHHQRGDTQAAREWFAKAVDWMSTHQVDYGLDWIESELLRRELEQLLNTSAENLHDATREAESLLQG
jgi:hypothetical protein